MPEAKPAGVTSNSSPPTSAKLAHIFEKNGYVPRRAASEAVGKFRGRSIVYYVDNTGIFTSAWNCVSTTMAKLRSWPVRCHMGKAMRPAMRR